jgi:hypothetical protein
MIADGATYGLGFLGALMALKPPTKEQWLLKIFYWFGLILFVIVGPFANGKQRTIEQARQDKLQQNETDARVQ